MFLCVIFKVLIFQVHNASPKGTNMGGKDLFLFFLFFYEKKRTHIVVKVFIHHQIKG